MSDLIERQAVLDLCESKDQDYKVIHFKEDVECLPSVNIEKTGHWIYRMVRGEVVPCCSRCGLSNGTYYEFNFCPECGANMIEPPESEE